ncbi:prolyl oligopeptidase family serine peptidase [Mucilaginibacter corticis]|uniref:Prolyl oligopeptidase family serine peptidase n=1 Tax=Mucilaginibacter corticis TaxID=2597670 RepID=A0A556MMB7_9SPHI|nr:alpha/beta fold hydrolase [Mucilaginibacter corticis]TSJ41081.1 prolyl oligopeptidase family serine peptidase [Mucilaginibacter corticis]
MKKLQITLFLIFLTSVTFAQTMAGDWYGVLNAGGNKIHLVFHILQSGVAYSATMDSPDQGAKGLACDSAKINGNQLLIIAARYNIKYSGLYNADGSIITGTFTQNGGSLPLDLSRVKGQDAVAAPAKRPQDPVDFPYKQEQVTFKNSKSGNTLAGTITLPSDGKVSKIVILVTGSGPQNRDEEMKQFNHRPFLVWSDWLTRHGIAVLRYDDRGVAQSTGDYSNATTGDLSDDAEAAVDYLLSRTDTKRLAIGIMGHSEGGMIAPMVASRNKNVRFVIMLAGPGVPVIQLMLKQTDDQLRLSGASEQARKSSSAINKKIFTLVADNPGLSKEALKIKIDSLMYRELRAMPKADLGDTNIDHMVKASDVQVTSAWYRYFISANPADYLVKVKCPLLALDGSKDMQVNAEMNLQGIRESMLKAGNKHAEVIELEGLNHLFQKAETGSLAEYSQITETIDPVALEKVADWINEL